MSRERIASYFWPESDAERARNALYQLVFGIRREMGDGAIEGTAGELRLGEGCLASDAAEFRERLDVGDLARAVDVYTGPFLDGVHLTDTPEFEEWIERTRQQFQARYHDALEQLASRAAHGADVAGAVRWTRLRAASEPVSTRAAIAHMRALAATGDHGSAVQYGRVHAALIRTQLGLEPGGDFDRCIAELRNVVASAITTTPTISSDSAAPQPLEFIHQTTIDDGNVVVQGAPSRRTPALDGRRDRLALRTARFGSIVLLVLVLAAALLIPARWPSHSHLVMGKTTQLTTGESVELEPALSPDGKLVAFAAAPPGQPSLSSGGTSVFVKHVAGGHVVPIASDSLGAAHSPRWSPDGSRIAFQTSTGIFAVPALGGSITRLVADSGQRLGMGSWSPDGKQFAFSNDRAIWVLELETGSLRRVTSTGFAPHSVEWSPDGRMLVYSVGSGDLANVAPASIWIVRAAGGTPVRITDLVSLNISPVFARDGRSVLYVSNRHGVRDIYQQRLGWGSRQRGEPLRLTAGSNAVSISLSADGKHLAYGAVIRRSNIWSVPLNGLRAARTPELTQLTFGNQEVECLSVSRDGRWLVYDSDRNGNQDIYRMPASGGEPIQLTMNAGDDFCGRMSPDNREIAFYSTRDGGRRRVYTMLFDGTRQQPVGDASGNQWFPDWSPDGNQIVFASDQSGRDELYLTTRAPGGTWSVPRAVTKTGGGGHGVAWSPDGKFVAWNASDSSVRLIPLTASDPTIEIPFTSTNGAFRHPHGKVFFTWGPDPSVIYCRRFADGNRSEIVAALRSGASSRSVLALDPSNVLSRRVEFATDGKRIFLTVADDQTTTWLIDLR